MAISSYVWTKWIFVTIVTVLGWNLNFIQAGKLILLFSKVSQRKFGKFSRVTLRVPSGLAKTCTKN